MDLIDLVPWGALGFIALAVVAYVAVRSVQAGRRGDDPAKAAAGAFRDVGPPALLAGVGVVAAVVLAAIAGLLFLIGMVQAVFSGEGESLAGAFAYMVASGLVLFGGAGTALWWAISRAQRRRRQ